MRRRLLPALIVSGLAALRAAEVPAAAPSAGCGRSPPDRPPTTFVVEGVPRQAITVVPKRYRPEQPHALVFAFHGRTNDNAAARRYFDLEDAAAAPTVFVYPAGLPDRSGRFTWADPGDPADALRDFAFFDTMLETLARAYCLDRDAVFVVGHSLGATFANSLACARGERLRGLASVAGGIHPALCSGGVAALLVHNPDDRLVPVTEGRRARDVLLGDAREPLTLGSRDIGDFACQLYAERSEEADPDPVFWCLHHEDRTRWNRSYPHRWPDGAATAIMRFFETLPG